MTKQQLIPYNNIVWHVVATWSEEQDFDEEKKEVFTTCRQAALAQQVARILGKDEVGGSNPLGSSEMVENKGFSRKLLFETPLFLSYYPN